MTEFPHTPAEETSPHKFSSAPTLADDLWQVESFGSSMVRARVTQSSILTACENQGFSENALFGIRLALEEALINAVMHGNKFDATKVVRVRYRVTSEQLEVIIEDQGGGFNPNTLPDPTIDENLDMPAGRGILLMRSYMDSVGFSPKGNCVTMTKRRAARS